MTMSTLLRTEAVGRLMDIQEVCNRVVHRRFEALLR
jgi:hypothetical protein